MKETCQGLGKEYNPLLLLLLFVQSDEITLVFTGNHMFGGTVQKYISNLASSATAYFKRTMVEKQVDFPLSDKAIAANPNIYTKEGEYYVNRTVWQEITVPRLSKIVEGTEKGIINLIFLEAIYETV